MYSYTEEASIVLAKSWTLRARLLGIIGFLGLLPIAAAAVTYLLSNSSERAQRQSDTASRGTIYLERINGLIYAVVMDSRGIYMSAGWKEAEPFAHGMTRELADLQKTVGLWKLKVVESERARVNALSTKLDEFVRLRSEMVHLAEQNDIAAASKIGNNDENRRTRSSLNDDLKTLAANYEALTGQAEQGVTDNERTNLVSLVVLSLLSACAFAGGLVLVARGLIRPLNRIRNSMERLAQGDLQAEVEGTGQGDEIGDMARAVEVFKKNAIEKGRLEESEAREQAAGERRQEEIDQLVGFFGRSVSGVFNTLSAASANMARTSSTLETSAAETGNQTRSVLAEIGRTAETVQTVAAASQELAASIDEIGRQASESSRITSAAMQQADDVVVKVAELSNAAQQIGTVVQLINSIASQTNLLALNATIEAARAGEAGRGFAVVASEVKSLANQTANATGEIGGQIAAIQAATVGAAEAIQGIAATVRQVNEIATSIASAVVEQGAATQEITRSVELVSSGAAAVARSMTLVSDAVGNDGGGAAEVKRTAQTLSAESGTLSTEVKDFLDALQDLGGGAGLRSLELNAPASVTADGRSIQGRVLKLSPGFALFAGALTVAPGTPLELRIDGIDRPLPARFVETGDGGVYLQLPLNHEHLTYMGQALTRLGRAAAA